MKKTFTLTKYLISIHVNKILDAAIYFLFVVGIVVFLIWGCYCIVHFLFVNYSSLFQHVKQAKAFEELVWNDNRFEVLGEVTMGLVCFRLKVSHVHPINSFTQFRCGIWTTHFPKHHNVAWLISLYFKPYSLNLSFFYLFFLFCFQGTNELEPRFINFIGNNKGQTSITK